MKYRWEGFGRLTCMHDFYFVSVQILHVAFTLSPFWGWCKMKWSEDVQIIVRSQTFFSKRYMEWKKKQRLKEAGIQMKLMHWWFKGCTVCSSYITLRERLLKQDSISTHISCGYLCRSISDCQKVKMVSQESVFPIISHDAAQPDNTPLADWLDGQHAVFISSGFLPIHLPMYEAVDELNPLRGIWKSYVCTFNNLSSNQSTIRTASTGQHPYSTCYKPCNLASAM